MLNAKRQRQGQSLMGLAKETVGLGIMTGAGSAVIGGIGGVTPGGNPGSAPINSALNILNTAQLARVGMHVARMPSQMMANKKKGRGMY